jgi:hypothetical protein
LRNALEPPSNNNETGTNGIEKKFYLSKTFIFVHPDERRKLVQNTPFKEFGPPVSGNVTASIRPILVLQVFIFAKNNPYLYLN